MEDNTLVIRTLAYRIIEDKLEELSELLKYEQEQLKELNKMLDDWRGMYE